MLRTTAALLEHSTKIEVGLFHTVPSVNQQQNALEKRSLSLQQVRGHHFLIFVLILWIGKGKAIPR